MPFSLSSPYMAYNYSSNIGGALFARGSYPALEKYYFSRHIVINSEETRPFIMADEIWYTDSCFDHQFLATNMLSEKDVKALFLSKLKEDFYITFSINEKTIPYSAHYNKNDFYHDMVVYGYDGESDSFLTAAYDATGQFQPHQLDAHSLIENALNIFAVNQVQPSMIRFYRPRDLRNEDIGLNISHIKDRMKEYLEGDYIYAQYFPGHYGMRAYDRVIERLRQKEWINIAGFHALWEHKKMMCKRLQLLADEGVDIAPELLLAAQDIMEKSLVLKNLYLKYQVCENDKGIENLIASMSSIAEKEMDLFPKIIARLA